MTFNTPEDIREIAVALNDAVSDGNADEVLWQSQELAKAFDSMWKYHLYVHKKNEERLEYAKSPHTQTPLIMDAITDAIDIGDYGEAEIWLQKFRRTYDYQLQLDAMSARDTVL